MERLSRIYRYEQACEFLPGRLKRLALALPDKQKERTEEFRLRVMHPMTVLTSEGELNAAPNAIDSLVTAEDLEQMLYLKTVLIRQKAAGRCRSQAPPPRRRCEARAMRSL